jgi:amino acid transporter
MATREEAIGIEATPKPTLNVIDAIAVIVGIVVGAGIFKTPSLVAANAGDEKTFLLLWPIGGLVSLVGALCYAELSSAYPHAGGDYYYLTKAFGGRVAFLFAWARLAVIQTGSIATLAFVFGDYMTQVFRLGQFSSVFYAVVAVVFLSWLHSRSVRQGTRAQNLLAAAKVLGLISVIVAGFAFGSSSPSPGPVETKLSFSPGFALVFVLFTFGGWNEISFVSAEMRDVQRNMLRALLFGIGIITAIFLLANLAYLKGLGIEGIVKSDVVAADLMRHAFGASGAKFISILIAIATLGAASVTIFTGARTNFALGQSFTLFRYMGQWNEKTSTPRRALLVQCIISFALILLGAWTRKGFETLVEYTAPVFWLFFLLTGVSMIVLRAKDKERTRPFRAPLYPLTPLIFIAACAYMFYSSVVYVSKGAFAGVIVLLIGLPVMFVGKFGK